jgi:hypothetical protein
VTYHPADADVGKRLETLIEATFGQVLVPPDNALSAWIVVLSPEAKQDRTVEQIASSLGEKIPVIGILADGDAAGSVSYEYADLEYLGRLYNFFGNPDAEIARFIAQLPANVADNGAGSEVEKTSFSPSQEFEFFQPVSLQKRRRVLIIHHAEDRANVKKIAAFFRRERLKVDVIDIHRVDDTAFYEAACLVPVLTIHSTKGAALWEAILNSAAAQAQHLFPIVIKSAKAEQVAIPSRLLAVQNETLEWHGGEGGSGWIIHGETQGIEDRLRRVTAAILKAVYEKEDEYNRPRIVTWSPFDQFRLLYRQLFYPRSLLNYTLGGWADVQRIRRTFWWLACSLGLVVYLLTAVELQSLIGIYGEIEDIWWLPKALLLWASAGLLGGVYLKDSLQLERAAHWLGAGLLGVCIGLSLNTLTANLSAMPAQSEMNPPVFAVGLVITLMFAFASAARGRGTFSLEHIISLVSGLVTAGYLTMTMTDAGTVLVPVLAVGLTAFALSLLVSRSMKIGYRSLAGMVLFGLMIAFLVGLVWTYFIFAGIAPYLPGEL